MRDNPLLKAVIATLVEHTGGDKGYISETELAQIMDISRTRLRETLQTLSAYGIIEKRQKLGVAIKPITREMVEETYDLRELLESHAMKVALNKVTAADIAELNKFAQTIQLANSMQDWQMAAQYDLLFHRKIIAIAALPLLERILDNLHLIENSFAYIGFDHFDSNEAPYSHQEIIKMLQQGDKNAVKLLQRHIAWTKKKELKKFDRAAVPEQALKFQPINSGGDILTAVNY